MKNRLVGTLAVLAMMLAFAAPAVADAPNDCPDPQSGDFVDGSTSGGEEGEFTVDGVLVHYEVSDDGKTITFSQQVTFCVKGGSEENSGVVTGTSYTVTFENAGGQNPAISNFVVYSVTPPTPVTAAAASVTAPTCSAAGMLVVPANTDSVTYSVSPAYSAGATGPFTVTATANAGFALTGTSQWTLTVAPQLTGSVCASAVTAAAASLTAPSCTAAGMLVIPANTASVTYSVTPAYSAGATGTYVVTATANAGFVLTGTSQWTLTVSPMVTGAACVSGGGTLPGNPSTPVRAGTAGSTVPNTAMDAPGADSLPTVLVALVMLSSVAYVARRNLLTFEGRR